MLDLSKIPLTESILQSCFKSKTYVRDGNWDILWYLGGKNDVTIGEKEGKYYLMPTEKVETVVEILPRGIVQGQNVMRTTQPLGISKLSDIEKVFPEVRNYIQKDKVKFQWGRRKN